MDGLGLEGGLILGVFLGEGGFLERGERDFERRMEIEVVYMNQ